MRLISEGTDKGCRYILKSPPATLGEGGFTFVELMIALVLSLIVMLPLFNLLIDQQKTYQVQSQMINMRQNARIGLDIMTKELRMAGYGIPASTWPDPDGAGPLLASLTPEVKIAQTPNATSITFYCNLEGVKTVLSADEAIGQTVLSVESTDDFSTEENKNNVYIEGPDDASPATIHWHSSTITAIDSVSSPKTITINNALNFKYLQGSTIHKKDTIIYSFSSGDRKITRTRHGTAEVLAYEIQGMTLNYTFEDGGTGLPIDSDSDTTNNTSNIRMVNISVTAQTADKDPFLNTNRTTTFTSDVTPINLAY